MKLLKKWYLILIGGFILFSFLVFMIRGENSVIAIHDNLDLFVPQYRMMKNTGTFFSLNATVPFLDNISRNVLPSEFSLYTLLYLILPAYYAYIVGYILKILVALFGVYFLAKDILGEKSKEYSSIVLLCGFAYGLLNVFPNFGICFSSVPILVLIMRHITRKDSALWYVALFFYPFISYFSYFGIFILGYSLIYFVYRWIRTKKFPLRNLLATVVLAVGYVLFEYRLFLYMFLSPVETIRSSMVMGNVDFSGLVSLFVEAFTKGDMHSQSSAMYFVMPVCLVFIVVQTVIYIKEKNVKGIFTDPLNGIVLFIAGNSAIYALYYSETFREIVETVLPPLSGFQFSRTVFFNPFLWYAALFIVCKRLYTQKVWLKVVSNIIAVIAVLIVVFSNTRYNDLYNTCYDIAKETLTGNRSDSLSFGEFYSTELFDKALEDIDYNGEWAAAYGFYPATLEYNGIKTLDGYLGFYSQPYKEYFRKIIAPALDLMSASAQYFDEWGARCYLYSGTYPSITGTGRYYPYTNEDIYIDLNAFKDLGGRYIFSRVMIDNAEDTGLDLAGTYTDDASPYVLYVYRTSSIYKDIEHSDVAYEDRLSFSCDEKKLDRTFEILNEYIEEANALRESTDLSDEEIVAKLGKEDEVLSLLDDMSQGMKDMSTCYEIATIEYYKDIQNEEWIEKSEDYYEKSLDYADERFVLLSSLCKSPYIVTAKKAYYTYLTDSFIEYEEMTDKQLELELKYQSLIKDYEAAASEEYYYDYKGKTWSFDSVMQEGYLEEDDDLMYIFEGLYEEKAKAVGEIYLDILDVCYEIAQEAGYDSYSEYVYENKYTRDYSVDDAKKLCKEVRNHCRDYIVDMNDLYYQEMEHDPGYITENDTETFEKLKPYMGKLSPELEASMEYLLKYNLYDLDQSDTKFAKGFTLNMDSYKDAYIVDSPYLNSIDLFTFVHEFGHYNNSFYSEEDEFGPVNNMDLCEIHSQGLELLFSDYYPEIFGHDTGVSLIVSDVSNLALITYRSCMTTEFEIYAHEHHGELTVEELGKYYKKLMGKYGYDYGIDVEGYYDWVEIPHIFSSPMYTISYATSALGAFDIYALAEDDRDLAVEKYLTISSLSQSWGFREMLDFVGMDDIFEKGVPQKIMGKTFERLEKITDEYKRS